MASIETRAGTRGTSYRVIWRDRDGKRRTKSWQDEAKAEMWRGLIESVRGDEKAAVQHLARKASQAMTVQAVADHRLSLLRATSYTRQTYGIYMREHIGPAVGDWPVDTVTDDDCRRFVIGLERKGLSPKYIHNICGWFTSVLKHAEERGWRTGNPMKPEMLPKLRRTDEDEADKFLTLEEATAIIDRMPPRWRDPSRLMLATGMRPAELQALTVGDVWIDRDQAVVRVTKALKKDRETGPYVGDPKSASSKRSLGIPPSVVEMLRPHVEGRKSSEILFPNSEGGHFNGSTFAYGFSAGAERARKAGLLDKRPSPYSLRHTHASLMLSAGMGLWQLSRHMGHRNQAITEEVYAHLMPTAQFEAASFAQKALGK